MESEPITTIEKNILTQTTTKEKSTQEYGIMSPDNVVMVIPKTEATKQYFKVKFGDEKQKIPEIKFESKAKYNMEYIKHILEAIKKSKCENITFSMGSDQPLKAECDDFIFYLAPRVEQD